jgi:hypothetical protein
MASSTNSCRKVFLIHYPPEASVILPHLNDVTISLASNDFCKSNEFLVLIFLVLKIVNYNVFEYVVCNNWCSSPAKAATDLQFQGRPINTDNTLVLIHKKAIAAITGSTQDIILIFLSSYALSLFLEDNGTCWWYQLYDFSSAFD